MKRALPLVIVMMLFAGAADAFRPSVRWILLNAADRQIKRKVQTLKIEQDAVVHGIKSAPRGYATAQQTFVRTPFQMREVLKMPDGDRIEIATDKRVMVNPPKGEAKSRKAGANLFLHLAAAGPPATEERIADAALADMQRYGVDTGVVSYGRFDGRIAYVIGGRSWETDRSTVWIDKTTFQLLKVVVALKVRGKPKIVETRYTGWSAADVQGWWPKAIERYENGALMSRLVTTSIERNELVDRALFTIDR